MACDFQNVEKSKTRFGIQSAQEAITGVLIMMHVSSFFAAIGLKVEPHGLS
jgi:hypothetical protein